MGTFGRVGFAAFGVVFGCGTPPPLPASPPLPPATAWLDVPRVPWLDPPAVGPEVALLGSQGVSVHPAEPLVKLEPPAPPPSPLPSPPGPRSPLLRDARFHDPMPGGYVGGWYGDTGLDIACNHLPVYAIAAGTLDYSERGHTLWMDAPDTPYSVRLALDEPIPWKGHRVTHVYYTHMSKLEVDQPAGASVHRHVEAGEPIGVSGVGNHVAHLHLGLLLDGQVEQDSWSFILREDDIRKLFGGYKNGELLPAFHP